MLLVTHFDEDYGGDNENDYNDCDTPNTSKVDETTFTKPSSADGFL